MAIRLDSGERGGDRVVDLKDVTVAIGSRTLLEGVTVTARRQDVIALVGANGTGKTTLLATILGAHPPATGEVRLGASITAAWYRQDLAGVPLDRKIFDIIKRPLIAETIENVVFGQRDLSVVELEIQPGSWLEGRVLGEIELSLQYNLILLGVVDRELGDEFIFLTGRSEHRLDARDMLVVIGPAGEIERFRNDLSRQQ